MELLQIKELPEVHKKVHEGIYKVYHVLIHVLRMIERGDSKETIYDTIKLLYGYDFVERNKSYIFDTL